MTKQQIAFELLVAGEIPALAPPTPPTINHRKMWQMWFDICILGLINEHSCSRGGKSHKGRCEGFCWRLEPWRKASSCVYWHSTQVGSCCCPRVNLSIHSNHLSFLFNFANDNNKLCMCNVHLIDCLICFTLFFTFTESWKKTLFQIVDTFLWESKLINLRWGCQVHKESKQGCSGHLAKVWSTDDATCELLPRQLFQNWKGLLGGGWKQLGGCESWQIQRFCCLDLNLVPGHLTAP